MIPHRSGAGEIEMSIAADIQGRGGGICPGRWAERQPTSARRAAGTRDRHPDPERARQRADRGRAPQPGAGRDCLGSDLRRRRLARRHRRCGARDRPRAAQYPLPAAARPARPVVGLHRGHPGDRRALCGGDGRRPAARRKPAAGDAGQDQGRAARHRRRQPPCRPGQRRRMAALAGHDQRCREPARAGSSSRRG